MEQYKFKNKFSKKPWFEKINGVVKLEEKKRKEKKSKDVEEYVMDSKVMNILKKMHKDRFTNENGRKNFIELMTALMNSRDRTARKIFKIIGKYLNGAVDEILKQYEEANEKV